MDPLHTAIQAWRLRDHTRISPTVVIWHPQRWPETYPEHQDPYIHVRVPWILYVQHPLQAVAALAVLPTLPLVRLYLDDHNFLVAELNVPVDALTSPVITSTVRKLPVWSQLVVRSIVADYADGSTAIAEARDRLESLWSL